VCANSLLVDTWTCWWWSLNENFFHVINGLRI
jgi:hypothetical protein